MSEQPATGPEVVMAKLTLPMPVREFAAICDTLDRLAKEDGCRAYVRQVGGCYEVYKVSSSKPEKPA